MTHLYLEQEISCITINPKDSRQIIISQLDGCVSMYEMKCKSLNSIGSLKLDDDSYVRDIVYMEDGKKFTITTSECAIGLLDTVTMEPLTWINEATSAKPSALLNLGGDKGVQTVVGDDEGNIKMFDFRTQEGAVLEFSEQKDAITDLKFSHGSILATSSDGHLCVYDLRKKKVSVKSEQADAEYNCICITNRRTYIGTGDGVIDVYKNGDYGYMLERIDTKMKYGIDSIIEARENLLLCASMTEDFVKFVNVQPNKVLKKKEVPFPMGKIIVDSAKKFFIGYGMCENFYHCSLAEITNDIPVITMENVKNTKKLISEENNHGFFDDLLEKKEEENDVEDEEMGEELFDFEDSDEIEDE
uniref:WD_REPEATS_REGION domain-containing protein n=1 Tax=Parastrongyloides trichosuri TaxID=131310 RepID=A0A0N4ZV70_PARTI